MEYSSRSRASLIGLSNILNNRNRRHDEQLLSKQSTTRLLFKLASLMLVYAQINQISGAFLDSKTIDGSISLGSSSGASAAGASSSSTSASASASASASSSSAGSTSAGAASQSSPMLSPSDSNINADKQLVIVLPGSRSQLAPSSGISSAAAASGSLPSSAYGQVVANSNNRIGLGSSLISEADKLKRLEEFRRSPYYLDPFEAGLVSLPEMQLQFEQSKFPQDFELFKQIAREGIERRGKFGSSVALVMKYGAKIIGTFIRNRKDEMSLPDARKPKPEFFDYLADLVQKGIEMSTMIKKQRPYTKSNVDSVVFGQRVENLFNYIARILGRSPFGLYVRWAELQLYKDDPSNPRYGVNVLDEGADLFAQWRAMGYESSTFLGKRIVNMLRLFAKSKSPSVDDV